MAKHKTSLRYPESNCLQNQNATSTNVCQLLMPKQTFLHSPQEEDEIRGVHTIF